MRKPLIDPSSTNEEKIKKLSMIVDRLTRRVVKQTSAIITPYTISNCSFGEEVKGDILKYMFCCPGKLNKGGIFLNAKPKSGAAVVLNIENDLGEGSRSYNITRRNLIFEPNIEISTWDRLTVSFFTVNPEEDKMTEIWISLLWTPTIKDVQIKSYLIDQLEEQVDVPKE
uniref:Uncharacterized protein n=1 Tax=viral metagenome TaxID=1070528 RepID=A0A6H1ZBQ4_9ZZZZ